jgi:starvation-inducible DNA-binding protein
MHASPELRKNCQAVLVDLLELQLQSKQFHWNVVGTNFRDLHRQLDEINHEARHFADQMAERMRALEVTPDGRTATIAKATTLSAPPEGEVSTTKAVPLITQRLDAVVATCRDVHDQVDEEDPTTADILHGFIERLEQFSWMVSAERRKPQE